jgi:hypothetical protein
VNRPLEKIRLRLQREDGGYALLVVIGVSVILLAMVATSLTAATAGLRKAATDEDFNASLNAAYAGLEEYQTRLANDATYSQYGNPDSEFTKASKSLVVKPKIDNPALGVAATDSWAQIPGSNGRSSYRYEVDNSKYQASGILRLRVTGRVDNATRTIVADLRQTGFIDFLYFTDLEVSDPQLGGVDSCAVYWWAGRDSACQGIQFGAFDKLTGPVHSNDKIKICGGSFTAVTTSNTRGDLWEDCGSPTFEVGDGPTYRSPISMPPTNSDMKKETRNDLAVDVPRPGCLYTGPTQVTFLDNGTMKVVSPWTKYVNYPATSAQLNAQCGTPGYAKGQLGNADGAIVPVPENNLVFVQNVPASGSGDVNAWDDVITRQCQWVFFCQNVRTPSVPDTLTCTSASGSTYEGWKVGTVSYPLSGESQPAGTDTSTPAYGCRSGDLFVKGKVNGSVTTAAENFVYITGDLTYADKTDDILGVVGQNAVWVWNPVNGTTAMQSDTDRRIDAAILSVAHTFTVQNYTKAKKGTLYITGAIAQRFRGPVAQSSGSTITTGYKKEYAYDTRFRYTAPPKFLTPVSTTYGVTQVASVASAFTAKGAKQ